MGIWFFVGVSEASVTAAEMATAEGDSRQLTAEWGGVGDGGGAGNDGRQEQGQSAVALEAE